MQNNQYTNIKKKDNKEIKILATYLYIKAINITFKNIYIMQVYKLIIKKGKKWYNENKRIKENNKEMNKLLCNAIISFYK